jgi:sec-independent protein translocase protein TatA
MYILGVVGPGQVMIIALVIVLLFFGGKKIPELMKGLGRGVKEFKDASKGNDSSSSSTEVSKTDAEEK